MLVKKCSFCGSPDPVTPTYTRHICEASKAEYKITATPQQRRYSLYAPDGECLEENLTEKEANYLKIEYQMAHKYIVNMIMQ